MRTRKRRDHLLKDVDGSRDRHRPFGNLTRERSAEEVFHHKIEFTLFGLAHVMNVDDMRVIDTVGRTGLAEHPRPQMRLLLEVGTDELEGDDPLDENVSRAIDDTHPPLAEASL